VEAYGHLKIHPEITAHCDTFVQDVNAFRFSGHKESTVFYLLCSAIYVSNIMSLFRTKAPKRRLAAHVALPIEGGEREQKGPCGTDVLKSRANKSISSNDIVCCREYQRFSVSKIVQDWRLRTRAFLIDINCDLSAQ
jgi:hypothetical protein